MNSEEIWFEMKIFKNITDLVFGYQSEYNLWRLENNDHNN